MCVISLNGLSFRMHSCLPGRIDLPSLQLPGEPKMSMGSVSLDRFENKGFFDQRVVETDAYTR